MDEFNYSVCFYPLLNKKFTHIFSMVKNTTIKQISAIFKHQLIFKYDRDTQIF